MGNLLSFDRVLVFGAGALGSYFGAQIFKSGKDVTFVARGRRLSSLKRDGLTLSNASGYLEKLQINAAEKPEGIYDLILFTTKSKDTKAASEICRRSLAPSGVALSLQNGVKNTEELQRFFTPDRVIGGAVFGGFSLSNSGTALYKPNVRLTIGAVTQEGKKYEEPLSRLFRSAGISCRISGNIKRALWRKLVWNIMYNPLSALLGAACGDLVDNKRSYQIMKTMGAEVVAAAAESGVALPNDVVEKALDLPPEFQAYKTSSLQDVEANRAPESIELMQPIAELADTGKIYAPVCKTIYEISKYKFGRWFHTFPRLAADVLVINGGKALLIERKYPPFGWAIPGGMADYGEMTEESAVRELREETGIEIKVEELNLLGVYSSPERDVRGHTVSVIYYAYSDQAPIAADDAKSAAYFELDNLPELAFDHKTVIEDYLKISCKVIKKYD